MFKRIHIYDLSFENAHFSWYFFFSSKISILTRELTNIIQFSWYGFNFFVV
jgi:hypothetical protein